MRHPAGDATDHAWADPPRPTRGAVPAAHAQLCTHVTQVSPGADAVPRLCEPRPVHDAGVAAPHEVT